MPKGPQVLDGAINMNIVVQRSSLVDQTAEALRRALQERLWIGHLPGERELSRQLNVSRPTLRLALNALRAEGRLKVVPGSQRKIIDRASEPASGAGPTVAVLTPLPLPEVPPFALCWMDCLRDLLGRAGMRMEIHSGRRWYSRRPEKDLASLVRQAPAAAWLLFVTTERMQRWFGENELPAVLCGSCYPGIDLPSVDFDYRAICRHAAGQFLRRGHRRIALFLEASDTAGDRESAAGFLEAFQSKTGAAATPIIVQHDGQPEDLRRHLRRLLQSGKRPSAFLVARSMPALTVASELMRHGLRLPQDAAVIARDSDHFHEYFSPQLARYRADPENHAKRLARLLVKRVRGEASRSMSLRVMPRFLSGESLG